MAGMRALWSALVACVMVSTSVAQWRPNPYLLVDETLISSVDNLDRQVQHPSRLSEPIVDAVQAYVTVGEISDRLRSVFGEYRET